ncbi:hypothetical protein I4U23_025172 [Adineta vaga]|nr:hypothetical protein I4U23_025172 [Adineta vaga]
MLAQQLVYGIGLFNLILAGVAVFCVTEAENHPEHFSLVYIAISIFVFYMGTILVIIILQIIETCQERQEQNLTNLLEMQVPSRTSQTNEILEDNSIVPNKSRTIYLSRSQTVPMTLSSSNFEAVENTSSEMITAPNSFTVLPKYRQTSDTMHKNYESTSFITNDNRNSS